jgi:hypothetical protein
MLEPWDPERPFQPMRAADSGADAEVALFFFPRELADRQEPIREQLRDQCETLRRNPHPLFLNVLDSGQQDDLFYLVQERPRGETLLSRIRQGRMTRTPFPTGEALGMCWLICRALQSMKPFSGHGFLNPQEIFLEPWEDGPLSCYPKVAHAGLRTCLRFSSMAFEGLEEEARLYAAPEFLGWESITEETDYYGIGALLYSMLTLRPPTGCFLRPARLHPGFPDALEEALLRALEEDPRERCASPGAFSRTLKEQALAGVRWEEIEEAESRLALPDPGERTGAMVLVRQPVGADPKEHLPGAGGIPDRALPVLFLVLLSLILLGFGYRELSLVRMTGEGRLEEFRRWELLFNKEAESSSRNPYGASGTEDHRTGEEPNP